MVRMGIIGLGYWGPNLVRCFHGLPECEVTYVCDQDAKRLQKVCDRFPGVCGTTSADDILRQDQVDAVVVATPTRSHYELAKQALDAGLHTFVEKPLATSSEECEDLIHRAEQSQCVLFVGHVFLYTAAVAKLKELVANGELGDVYYISSTRLNLGPVRRDVNALWDLAPHDISIMLELMGTGPESVSCSGLAYLDESIHDVCNLTMQFADKRMCIVHVSWLDPHKRRMMTIVGSKKMAVYDDIQSLEKIRIYDNGVDTLPYTDSFGEFPYSYRYGDIYCPRLQEVEPLQAEAHAFVDSILFGTRPKTDGYNGLGVVEVLEAADRSLRNGGGQETLRRASDAPWPALAALVEES